MRDRLARQRKPDGMDLQVYRRLQVILGAYAAGEQRFYLSTQLRITPAGLIQEAQAFVGFALDGAMEQFLDLRPALRTQGAPTRFASGG